MWGNIHEMKWVLRDGQTGRFLWGVPKKWVWIIQMSGTRAVYLNNKKKQSELSMRLKCKDTHTHTHTHTHHTHLLWDVVTVNIIKREKRICGHKRVDALSHNAWLLGLGFVKAHGHNRVMGDESAAAFSALSIFLPVCLFVIRSLHLLLLCIGSLPHVFIPQTDGAAGKCGQRSQLCSSHYSLSLFLPCSCSLPHLHGPDEDVDRAVGLQLAAGQCRLCLRGGETRRETDRNSSVTNKYKYSMQPLD